MKKLISFCVLVGLLSQCLFAQNNIKINIHHKLGQEDFSMNTPAKNNIDHDFNVNRLEYYISNVSFIHDGGTETLTKEFIELINTADGTKSQLLFEDLDITSLEAIRLHIGVDPDRNNLDPATYPSDHPLAPQNPSMHWGWSAGYRFVALEGKASSNYNQIYEFHALGNTNYLQTEIPVAMMVENNEIIVNLDADYTRLLEDMQVNDGIIVHGDDTKARQLLTNFRDYVFTIGSGTTSTEELSKNNVSFSMAPNPTIGKRTSIILSADDDFTYDVQLTDLVGRPVQYFSDVASNSTLDLELEHAGFYFVSIVKNGKQVLTKKLWSY